MASMEEEAAVICILSDWTVLSDWLIFRPVEAPTKVTSITLIIWVIATNHGTGSASVRSTSCRIQKKQHLTKLKVESVYALFAGGGINGGQRTGP